MPSPLLEIHNATKIYSTPGFMGREGKSVVALDNFNLRIDAQPATITTIAGESGSGKTTLANLVLGFIRLTSGKIVYNGEDVTEMTDDQLKMYRRNVQAVFQDPFGVYNPFYRINHVFQTVNQHFNLSDNQSEYRDMVEAGLNVVGLYGEDVLRKYPHQLSGGQRQRIMMARAYMIKPRLIVADEPVSMVDASLRASILDAMLRLRDEHNISFLYITHDLSTAYQIGDQIYMLYQGTTAERGTAMDVIDSPQHPYVQLLIDSVPVPDPTQKWDVDISLPSEEEMRTAHSKGCRYYPRCPHRMDKCLTAQPPLYVMSDNGHEASCYLYDENAIAPILELSEIEVKAPVQSASSNRGRWVAAIGAILIIGALILLSGGSGEESEVADATTDSSAVVEEPTEVAVSQTDDDEPEPTEVEMVVSDPVLLMDGAEEKAVLEYDTPVTDEITDESEKHSYTFEGSAGDSVLLKVNAEGSAFTSPYGELYGPDGEFVVPIGDTTERATRSYRIEHTLESDGTYTIIVAPFDGSGIEEYAVVVETIELASDADSGDTDGDAVAPVVSDPVLLMDGAEEKAVLEYDTPVTDEIIDESEKHSYTFEGSAGDTVLLKVNAEGSAFTSPYGELYGPDGEFVVPIGDTTERATRSYRIEHTLASDGTYTIIVAPFDGSGIEEYAVVVEAVALASESDNSDTDNGDADTSDAESAEVVVSDPVLLMDGAEEKAVLEYDMPVTDEITDESEKHSYTFEGTAGDVVLLKVNAEGSAFTSPYGELYGPDGEFIAPIGDTTERATRSYRTQQTLDTDGTYTIIVAPFDGSGIEEYAVVVETVESE